MKMGDYAEKDRRKAGTMLEFADAPGKWKLSDAVRFRMGEEAAEQAEAYPFDWGDVLNCASGYLTKEQIEDFCEDRPKYTLDGYCRLLWNRDWPSCYRKVRQYYFLKMTSGTIVPLAKQGCRAALGVVADGLLKIGRDEGEEKKVTVTFVNDIGGKTPEKAPSGLAEQKTGRD